MIRPKKPKKKVTPKGVPSLKKGDTAYVVYERSIANVEDNYISSQWLYGIYIHKKDSLEAVKDASRQYTSSYEYFMREETIR